jgi:hypothetical protein
MQHRASASNHKLPLRLFAIITAIAANHLKAPKTARLRRYQYFSLRIDALGNFSTGARDMYYNPIEGAETKHKEEDCRSTRLQKNTRIRTRIWQSFTKNVSPLTLIVAIIAACGNVPGIVSFSQDIAKHFRHQKAPSYSTIAQWANQWKNVELLNYGDSSYASAWRGFQSNNEKSTQVDAYPDFLRIWIHRSQNDDNFAFFQNTTQAAMLPAGNFLLSYDVAASTGCYSGLLFNADYMDNRFAFFYVAPSDDKPYYNFAVSTGSTGLKYAFPAARTFPKTADRIGVIFYNGKYILTIDGTVVKVLTADGLSKLDNGVPLTSQGVGVGTITCPGQGWANYGFSQMQIRTP